jgi:hypothetical protein
MRSAPVRLIAILVALIIVARAKSIDQTSAQEVVVHFYLYIYP